MDEKILKLQHKMKKKLEQELKKLQKK